MCICFPVKFSSLSFPGCIAVSASCKWCKSEHHFVRKLLRPDSEENWRIVPATCGRNKSYWCHSLTTQAMQNKITLKAEKTTTIFNTHFFLLNSTGCMRMHKHAGEEAYILHKFALITLEIRFIHELMCSVSVFPQYFGHVELSFDCF